MRLLFDPKSADSYRQFIALKSIPSYTWTGMMADVPDEYAKLLNGHSVEGRSDIYKPSKFLFDYQRDIAAMAIKKRKFAVFAECGLGKTLILLEFAKHAAKQTGKRILIVSPLMVVTQTLEEAGRFYPKMEIAQVKAANLQYWLNSTDSLDSQIGITNYEAIRENLTQGNLGALILDECFPAGTKIDCIDENGNRTQKHIENVSCGDKIENANGVDVVIRTKRKKVKYACAITAGTRIITSPNHPVFTQRGWICAQDIEPGDSILQTREAVRIVRNGIHAERHARAVPVLREILLSEMANEPVRTFGESSYCRDSQENRQIEKPMVCSGFRRSEEGTEENFRTESNDATGSQAEGVEDSEDHEPQTFRAWWQWDRINASAEDIAECSWQDMGGGVCLVAGPTSSRISNTLQARRGESRNESRYRSGWKLASFEEGSGQEEGCDAGFVRVESLEILESGHPELERLRDESGELYFYDLEAERHPSFSVNGLLVHNSSMLKSHYGAWGTRLIELGKGLEWKACFTGTPAPNDQIEYANHAVFLDHKKTVNEFLARYFINRGETQNRWELKRHAIEPFYRDLSHWCLFLSNPSVYGWKDNCETVPPIRVHIDRVPLTEEQRKLSRDATGDLFANNIGGIGMRGKLSQIAKGKGGIETNKPEYIRNLVDSFGDRSTIIWCHYNDEQESMERAFPNAASISGDTPEHKRIEMVNDFKSGRVKQLISKAKILGFGLNLQIATKMVFSGLQDSYEEYWQCVKRANRIGSTEPLDVHIPVTELEEPMVQNVMRKADRVQKDTEEQERIFKANRLIVS